MTIKINPDYKFWQETKTNESKIRHVVSSEETTPDGSKLEFKTLIIRKVNEINTQT